MTRGRKGEGRGKGREKGRFIVGEGREGNGWATVTEKSGWKGDR